MWSNGSTTDSVSNLCAGTYTVTVTDSLGITISDTVVITEPPPIVVTDTTTNASCSICTNGTATANASGGTPPLSYEWSNGATTNTIDSLVPGTYTVTVTDANNCEIADTVTVSFDVGVQQLIVDNEQLIIYPNPVGEQLTMVNGGLTINTIEITDLVGRVVLKQSVTPAVKSIELNVSAINSGVYFVKVYSTQGDRSVKKIVKE